MAAGSHRQQKKEGLPQDKKQMPSASARKRLDALRDGALSIVQGELIGRTVTATPLKGGAGVRGRIVDETRDTLVVEKTDGKQARLIKRQHTFEFVGGNRRIRVNGSLIARRPEDRLKIKIRW